MYDINSNRGAETVHKNTGTGYRRDVHIFTTDSTGAFNRGLHLGVTSFELAGAGGIPLSLIRRLGKCLFVPTCTRYCIHLSCAAPLG